jgi:hypothetical protein
LSEPKIKFLCICGVEGNWLDWFKHIRTDGEHGIAKIINEDIGESVDSQKAAQDKGWLEAGRTKGKRKSRNKVNQKGESEKVKKEEFSKEEPKRYAETITGEVLQTNVKIHPYVYESFVQVMGMMPKKYPKDDKETFSKYILHLSIFFRLVTNSMLPWGDQLAKSIMQQSANQEEVE